VHAPAEQGDLKQALKRLERARQSALADEDIPALRDVLAECRAVHALADEKRRNDAELVMNAAQQNIRFLSRKAALAAGEEWVDPFPAVARASAPVSSPDVGSRNEGPLRVRMLLVHLAASFGVCAFLALAAAGNTDSDTSAVWTIFAVGVYWLTSAVLMVWWWTKGYDHFWRPMASWGLSLIVVSGLLGLPILLLLWPRFRRWLFRQLKPYDDRVSALDERRRPRSSKRVWLVFGVIAAAVSAGLVVVAAEVPGWVENTSGSKSSPVGPFLLQPVDLPSGWDVESHTGKDAEECLKVDPSGLVVTSQGETNEYTNGDTAYAASRAYLFKTRADASAALDRIAFDRLARCLQSVYKRSETSGFKVGRVSWIRLGHFPRLGDRSTAARVAVRVRDTGHHQQSTLYADVVAIQHDRALSLLLLENFGAPLDTSVEQRISLAVSHRVEMPFRSGDVSYGPLAHRSNDTGSCHNAWAVDSYRREFAAATTPDDSGKYTVTQRYVNGKFVTRAGPSPVSCGRHEGGSLRAGITGAFTGDETIVVSNGKYDPAATCTPDICDNSEDFVAIVYGIRATHEVRSYRYRYTTNAHGSWTNASSDSGGDSGDIATGRLAEGARVPVRCSLFADVTGGTVGLLVDECVTAVNRVVIAYPLKPGAAKPHEDPVKGFPFDCPIQLGRIACTVDPPLTGSDNGDSIVVDTGSPETARAMTVTLNYTNGLQSITKVPIE
jgi:hypothetical protein